MGGGVYHVSSAVIRIPISANTIQSPIRFGSPIRGRHGSRELMT